MNQLSRRSVLHIGAAGVIAAAAGVSACSGAAPFVAPSGLHMPLESAPHARSFMQWPVSLSVYDRAALARTQQAIARIANAIAGFEPVVMLAAARHHAAARRLLDPAVELWDIPTDDLWCRDSGPTFVLDEAGAPAVVDFNFNGWGNKQPHRNDARIAAAVAARLGLRRIDSGLVGEQGGVEHDGAGTLLAHASCWDNANRNRLGRQAIGDRLLAALGGTQMIWAPGIAGADITDYHIDSLARFVGPGRLLFQTPAGDDPADPWVAAARETMAVLRASTDASGQPLDIVTIAEPVDIRATSADFVSSYVNYYVCNGAVISAQFGDARADAAASETLAMLYPGRQIVALDIDALGESGGGIHCATQQQPLWSNQDAMR